MHADIYLKFSQALEAKEPLQAMEIASKTFEANYPSSEQVQAAVVTNFLKTFINARGELPIFAVNTVKQLLALKMLITKYLGEKYHEQFQIPDSKGRTIFSKACISENRAELVPALQQWILETTGEASYPLFLMDKENNNALRLFAAHCKFEEVSLLIDLARRHYQAVIESELPSILLAAALNNDIRILQSLLSFLTTQGILPQKLLQDFLQIDDFTRYLSKDFPVKNLQYLFDFIDIRNGVRPDHFNWMLPLEDLALEEHNITINSLAELLEKGQDFQAVQNLFSAIPYDIFLPINLALFRVNPQRALKNLAIRMPTTEEMMLENKKENKEEYYDYNYSDSEEDIEKPAPVTRISRGMFFNLHENMYITAAQFEAFITTPFNKFIELPDSLQAHIWQFLYTSRHSLMLAPGDYDQLTDKMLVAGYKQSLKRMDDKPLAELRTNQLISVLAVRIIYLTELCFVQCNDAKITGRHTLDEESLRQTLLQSVIYYISLNYFKDMFLIYDGNPVKFISAKLFLKIVVPIAGHLLHTLWMKLGRSGRISLDKWAEDAVLSSKDYLDTQGGQDRLVIRDATRELARRIVCQCNLDLSLPKYRVTGDDFTAQVRRMQTLLFEKFSSADPHERKKNKLFLLQEVKQTPSKLVATIAKVCCAEIIKSEQNFTLAVKQALERIAMDIEIKQVLAITSRKRDPRGVLKIGFRFAQARLATPGESHLSARLW